MPTLPRLAAIARRTRTAEHASAAGRTTIARLLDGGGPVVPSLAP